MNDPYLNLQTALTLLPEIWLVVLATVIYVGGAFKPDRSLWNLAALLGMILVGYTLYRQGMPGSVVLAEVDGPLLIDNLAILLRWLAFGAGVIFVLMATTAADDSLAAEYLGSLLLLVAGTMLVCSAGDLVLLFLALELISIPTYILLFLGRKDTASHEATTKYFFLSILSSALLLYGFSFLYGIGGSTDLEVIRTRLGSVEPGGLARLLPIGLMFTVAALAFRIAAVPFHFYAPDVYQGTTAGNAGLLAVVPKIAGIAALVRILAIVAPLAAENAWQIALAVALVTMTLGNTLALWQRNVRRILAYSSIAHAGYLLIGIAAALAIRSGAVSLERAEGYAAVLYYLAMYAVATGGAFAVLAFLAGRDREIDDVDDLAGLSRTYPAMAALLALFLLSLAGLPPLPGFWGKFTLFLAALDVDAGGEGVWRGWFLTLAIVAALNAAVAAAYYLRLVAAMFFRDPISVPQADGGSGPGLAAVLSAVLLVAASIFAGPLLEQANYASQSAQLGHAPLRPPTAAAAHLPANK